MHAVTEHGFKAEPRFVERRRRGDLSCGGLLVIDADPQRLQDYVADQGERRWVLARLAHMFGVFFVHGFSTRVVHRKWLEDLLPHEREEGLARRTLDGGAHQNPSVT